jgi:hypothetical protein
MTIPISSVFSGTDGKGIIVGCDHQQEWLLEWWWSKYAECNAYPVVFVDFGMSSEAKRFCEAQGSLVTLHQSMHFLASKEKVVDAQIWEAVYHSAIWQHRQGWFKKPLALYLSPFEQAIWLDLDCEVIGSLKSLFSFCEANPFAIASEQDGFQYNSGVIAFQRSSPLVREWMLRTFADTETFMGDQNLLSHLIAEKGIPITVLPSHYNWRVLVSDPSQMVIPPETVIVHWACEWGKKMIRSYGGLGEELRRYLMKLHSVP